jgi:hypothetical protein
MSVVMHVTGGLSSSLKSCRLDIVLKPTVPTYVPMSPALLCHANHPLTSTFTLISEHAGPLATASAMFVEYICLTGAMFPLILLYMAITGISSRNIIIPEALAETTETPSRNQTNVSMVHSLNMAQ